MNILIPAISMQNSNETNLLETNNLEVSTTHTTTDNISAIDSGNSSSSGMLDKDSSLSLLHITTTETTTTQQQRLYDSHVNPSLSSSSSNSTVVPSAAAAAAAASSSSTSTSAVSTGIVGVIPSLTPTTTTTIDGIVNGLNIANKQMDSIQSLPQHHHYNNPATTPGGGTTGIGIENHTFHPTAAYLPNNATTYYMNTHHHPQVYGVLSDVNGSLLPVTFDTSQYNHHPCNEMYFTQSPPPPQQQQQQQSVSQVNSQQQQQQVNNLINRPNTLPTLPLTNNCYTDSSSPYTGMLSIDPTTASAYSNISPVQGGYYYHHPIQTHGPTAQSIGGGGGNGIGPTPVAMGPSPHHPHHSQQTATVLPQHHPHSLNSVVSYGSAAAAAYGGNGGVSQFVTLPLPDHTITHYGTLLDHKQQQMTNNLTTTTVDINNTINDSVGEKDTNEQQQQQMEQTNNNNELDSNQTIDKDQGGNNIDGHGGRDNSGVTNTGSTTTTESSAHEYYVMVHVNGGETFSVKVQGQMQHIQGPATVRMVSKKGPPSLMPMQVPPGHLVQQIVDENGVLTHVILSPYPPNAMACSMTHVSPGNSTMILTPSLPQNMTLSGSEERSSHARSKSSLSVTGSTNLPHGHFFRRRKNRGQGGGTGGNNSISKNYSQRSDNQNSSSSGEEILSTVSPRLSNEQQQENSTGGGLTSNANNNSTRSTIRHILNATPPPQVADVEARTVRLLLSMPNLPDDACVEIDTAEIVFDLFLSETGAESYYKCVYRGDAVDITLRDLKPDTEYFVKACSCYHNIKGERTTHVRFVTQPCEPNAPKQPILSQRTRNSLTLKWSNAIENGSKLTGFILEWKDSGSTEWVELFTGLQRSYKVSKLTAATEYFFRLAATNSYGQSDWSDEVSFITSGIAPSQPEAPQLIRQEVHGLGLSWIKRQSDEKFNVEMEDEATCHGFIPIFFGDQLNHFFDNLRRNTRYRFRLAAENTDGKSQWSEIVTYTTLPDAPLPPKKLETKGKLHNTKFRLIWSESEDDGGSTVSSYRIQLFHCLASSEFSQSLPSTLSNDNNTPATPANANANANAMAATSSSSSSSSTTSSGNKNNNKINWIQIYEGNQREYHVMQMPIGAVVWIRAACYSQAGWGNWNSQPLRVRLPPTSPGPIVGLSLTSSPLTHSYSFATNSSSGGGGGNKSSNHHNVPSNHYQIQWQRPINDGGAEILTFEVEQKDLPSPTNSPVKEINKNQKTKTTSSAAAAGVNSAGSGVSPGDVSSASSSISAASSPLSTPSSPSGSNNSSGGIIVYRGTSTQCQIQLSTPGHEYAINVRAINEFNQPGPWCENPLQIFSGPGTPSAPLPPIVNWCSVKCSLIINWEPPLKCHGSPIIEYRLEMRLLRDGIITKPQCIYTGKELTYEVRSQLEPVSDYVFRVQAINSAGASVFSMDSTPCRTGAAPPSIIHEWNVSTEPPLHLQHSHYHHHHSSSSSSFIDDDSSNDLLTTLSQTKNHNSANSLWLQWKEPNDCGSAITGYHIEWMPDYQDNLLLSSSSSSAAAALATTAMTSLSSTTTTATTTTSVHLPPTQFYHVIIGLASDTSYRIRIQAENALGRGPFTNYQRVFTKSLPPPAPEMECTQVQATALKLKWNFASSSSYSSNTNASAAAALAISSSSTSTMINTNNSNCNNNDLTINLQYQLEMSRSSDSGWHTIYTGTSLSYKIVKLLENCSYYFRVRAINKAGAGVWSAIYRFTTGKAAPSSPKAPRITEITMHSCLIQWTRVKTLSQDSIIYTLQILSVPNNELEYRQVYRGSETNFRVQNLCPGTEYLARVCAIRLASSNANNSPNGVTISSTGGSGEQDSDNSETDEIIPLTTTTSHHPHQHHFLSSSATIDEDVMMCEIIGPYSPSTSFKTRSCARGSLMAGVGGSTTASASLGGGGGSSSSFGSSSSTLVKKKSNSYSSSSLSTATATTGGGGGGGGTSVLSSSSFSSILQVVGGKLKNLIQRIRQSQLSDKEMAMMILIGFLILVAAIVYAAQAYLI